MDEGAQVLPQGGWDWGGGQPRVAECTSPEEAAMGYRFFFELQALGKQQVQEGRSALAFLSLKVAAKTRCVKAALPLPGGKKHSFFFFLSFLFRAAPAAY